MIGTVVLTGLLGVSREEAEGAEAEEGTWTWWLPWVVAVVAVYLGIVRWLRYERYYATAACDVGRDYKEVAQGLGLLEMPLIGRMGSTFGLFHTYACPSISKTLSATREFSQHCQKRYDDTEILLGEVIEHSIGPESARGRCAVARMNTLHARYKITEEAYLYTLTLFVVTPCVYMDRWGWRAMLGKEKDCLALSWANVGARMGIRAEALPLSYAEFEAMHHALEEELMHFAPSNREIADATIALFLSWLPWPTRWLARQTVLSLMSPRMLEAFGMDPPPGWVFPLLDGALRLRSVLVRWCLPPRPAWWRATYTGHRKNDEGAWVDHMHPTYREEGYHIDALGPAKFARGNTVGVDDANLEAFLARVDARYPSD